LNIVAINRHIISISITHVYHKIYLIFQRTNSVIIQVSYRRTLVEDLLSRQIILKKSLISLVHWIFSARIPPMIFIFMLWIWNWQKDVLRVMDVERIVYRSMIRHFQRTGVEIHRPDLCTILVWICWT